MPRRTKKKTNVPEDTKEVLPDEDSTSCCSLTMADNTEESSTVVRIGNHQYVHILNRNTNVTRLVLGPRTYVCLQDEKIVLGPKDMISVPPTHYCVVENPVMKTASGKPVIDQNGQVKLRIGDEEYRFNQDSFPLYPGEEVKLEIQKLPVVQNNEALSLRALMDFVDEDKVQHVAGEMWLFKGPATYYPRKEVIVISTKVAETILPNTALCVRATGNFVDRDGIARKYGETWLVTKPGAYLPGVYEDVIEKREAFVLTDKVALHLRALEAHVDQFGRQHRRGDEWLVTSNDTDSYICNVCEEVVGQVHLIVLNAHQYCVIENPLDKNGKPQFGKSKVVRGENSFFLQPGEKLSIGIQNADVLGPDEGLILLALERFVDEIVVSGEKQQVIRNPGDVWMVYGPVEYIPPIEVKVVNRCQSIPLDRNEGIYVRNIRTGHVRSVIGHAYMLTHEEELWSKPIPPDVAELLSPNREPLPDRNLFAESFALADAAPTVDFTRVVTFQVPHNAAVQIYDYRDGRARVEFGPTLVMLGPEEQFTKLSLSGGKPKRPNVIQTLCLMLGPDFFTDLVVVETADHARLTLQLSYNWQFDVPNPCSQEEATKLFSVPDFIGAASKAIASRIRGIVATVNFDDFHKNSARIIHVSVFGLDENGRLGDCFMFPENNLRITSIDVQSVEPVDQRTRDSLQKSVQLAIEITTNSQEAAARREAERLEQEARGRLERQKIADEASAEEARRQLIETRVQLLALESTGQTTAEAKSRADAARIEAEATVTLAKLRAKASEIETESELERLRKSREAELAYLKELAEIKSARMKGEMQVEVARFQSMVQSIGSETIQAMATAGAEHNLRMLSALGLQSTLITDGTTPVNLLTTAHGLIGQLDRSNPNSRMDSGSVKPFVPPPHVQSRMEDAKSDDGSRSTDSPAI